MRDKQRSMSGGTDRHGKNLFTSDNSLLSAPMLESSYWRRKASGQRKQCQDMISVPVLATSAEESSIILSKSGTIQGGTRLMYTGSDPHPPHNTP